MPRAKTPELFKVTTLKVRLTIAEKVRIFEQADLAGISASEFMRMCAQNKEIFSSTDLTMLREMRRLGGLLKHVHVTSNGAYSSQTAAVLSELQSTIKGIALDHKKN